MVCVTSDSTSHKREVFATSEIHPEEFTSLISKRRLVNPRLVCRLAHLRRDLVNVEVFNFLTFLYQYLKCMILNRLVHLNFNSFPLTLKAI